MKRIYYYYMALAGFFGLFTLLMLWNTVISPSQHLPVALVIFSVITPLLLPFRGLLNGKLKSLTWMSYISLFYFTYGISEAYTNADELYLALLEIFFSLLLCVGSGAYVYTAEKKK